MKAVLIEPELHQKLKRVCIDNNIKLKDLIPAMLIASLDNGKLLQEIVSGVQARDDE